MCGSADFAALDMMLIRIMVTSTIALASYAAYRILPTLSKSFEKNLKIYKDRN